ncbi:MAG: T9SS type A sorting domain-containing protein [Bacteroidales bacterium]|nr:T9SS type A sorting domain-containing protein [Bacteroidales bacterium]
MKNQIFLLVIFIIGFTIPAESQTIIEPGDVSGTWNANGSPYLIQGNISVQDNEILTLDPGVSAIFEGHYFLSVKGVLHAVGNFDNPIEFTVSDTTGFTDTSSVAGGWHGIRFMENNSFDTSFLTHCKLSYGKAIGATAEDTYGGAIYSNNYSFIYISNSEISHNIALEKGGGVYYNATDVLIEHSTITYNRSYYYGGGIANGANCHAIIRDNVIARNIAYKIVYSGGMYWQVGAGGGFYASDAFNLSPLVENNMICNNASVNGGAIYESTTGIKVIGNILCNNRGEGIFNGHSIGQGKYINNTIVHNATKGGITTHSNYTVMINNIVWGNSNGNNWGVQINREMGANPPITYCNVQNGIEGEGNINEEPQFVDPTVLQDTLFNALLADWSLMDDSPCVNAGDPDTSGLYLPPLDLNGNNRVYGIAIDMGSLENQLITFENEYGQIAGINIFPNPAKDHVTIVSSEIESVVISNMNGSILKIVYPQVNNYKILDINISSLPKGIYIFQIFTKSSKIEKKIIKQ